MKQKLGFQIAHAAITLETGISWCCCFTIKCKNGFSLRTKNMLLALEFSLSKLDLQGRLTDFGSSVSTHFIALVVLIFKHTKCFHITRLIRSWVFSHGSDFLAITSFFHVSGILSSTSATNQIHLVRSRTRVLGILHCFNISSQLSSYCWQSFDNLKTFFHCTPCCTVYSGREVGQGKQAAW